VDPSDAQSGSPTKDTPTHDADTIGGGPIPSTSAAAPSTVPTLVAAGPATQAKTVVGSAAATLASGGASAATVVGATNSTAGGASFVSPDYLPTLEGYDIVRRVGKGGMGAVYEGVQQATGRRVAIKFLLDADLASSSIRERFEREVAIVARLDHTGIIRVIDSGVKRGRYFYVMDFVEGVSLDTAFERLRGDIKQALRLIVDLCEIVDYAHQRGVLHRDLKPSNIIVDREGKPRLLDFGIAKSNEGDAGRGQALTFAGEGGQSTIGTLAYMSPEQAAGQSHRASVRTDVYSLGVIAYECVTGQLPVPIDGSLREALTRVVEQEPVRPSTLANNITADLDAVLLKALEKAPERRYASASELAADLSRYLNGEPVTARHITQFARLVKWVNRNKAISATITIAAATLVAVSTLLIIQVLRERDDARQAANEARLAEQRAVLAFNDAKLQREQAVASAQEASENFDILRSILRSANSEAGGEVTVRQMLDRAIASLDRTPPKTPRTEASVRETLGVVYRNLGSYEKAVTLLKRAYEIRVLEADAPKADASDDAALAACAHELAASLWWRGDYAEAKPLYEQALAIRRKLHTGDHKDIAFSLTHLAANNLRLGNVDAAYQGYIEALEMRRRLYGNEHEEVAQSLNNLAKAYFEAEQYDRAESNFREALAMIRKLRGDEFGGTASVLQNLAQCLLEEGQPQAAIDTFSRALAIRSKLFPSGHHLAATTLVGLARAHLAAGDAAKADEFAARAVEMYRKLAYEGKPELGEALGVQGAVRLAQNRHLDAINLLTTAESMLSAAQPIPDIPLAQVEADIGDAMVRLGKSAEGKDHFFRGLDRVVRARGTESRLAKIIKARIDAIEER
jgi:eukaryotic-like serine/threonine-protein kinase